MEEKIKNLITSYQKRYQNCVIRIEELSSQPKSPATDFEIKSTKLLALIWQSVIKDLKELSR